MLKLRISLVANISLNNKVKMSKKQALALTNKAQVLVLKQERYNQRELSHNFGVEK